MYDIQYDPLDLIDSQMTLDQFTKMLDIINVRVILDRSELGQHSLKQSYFIPTIEDGIVIDGQYID